MRPCGILPQERVRGCVIAPGPAGSRDLQLLCRKLPIMGAGTARECSFLCPCKETNQRNTPLRAGREIRRPCRHSGEWLIRAKYP